MSVWWNVFRSCLFCDAYCRGGANSHVEPITNMMPPRHNPEGGLGGAISQLETLFQGISRWRDHQSCLSYSLLQLFTTFIDKAE